MLDQLLVVQGHAQLAIDFQRRFVGIQRCFQIAIAGQGIATVVMIGGVLAEGKALRSSDIVAGLVERMTLPLWINETLCGLSRLALAQQTYALLIGA